MSQLSNNTEYSIERLSLLNLAELDTLYRNVYSKDSAPGYFFKKYDTAYTGLQFTGFIAFTQKREAAAFYAVIPCFLMINGKKVITAQSADTMTHPLHRKKGLFVELSNLTFSLCKKEGIKLLFGFPNQNSAPGAMNNLGWEMAEKLDCYIIKTHAFPLYKICKKFPLLQEWFRRYQATVIRNYLEPENGVENSMLREGYDGLLRDKAYLDYKQYSKTWVVKLSSSLVWLKIKDEMIIGDIQSLPENLESCLNDLIKLARRLGIKKIQFHASPGTDLSRFFSKVAKAFPSFPVLFKNLGADVSFNQIKFTTADIDTF